MRLRKIKLAGFKSFVDPTTLQVSDNLVGIVGPNGCGKSNIIDAVTWVMGESSAKHLRGDSLTDVIFNGSSARQPVGQASVELVFDNSDGKLGGPYAGYSEVSIKRQLNRDTISTYYLNGTRCRRKDIQGIFLGTGIGPRSYSIIEQGVISRLIEARPEELRVFLEEAAGISKFRERRRETENRIRHTRDNISRLTDILEELEKQLEHLQRQARAAERFKLLKEEERRLKAEILALEWKELSGNAEEKSKTVRFHESRVEEGLARLRGMEADIEIQREKYTAANEAFNKTQADFYQVGSDISHTEQRINHARERIETLKSEIGKARQGEQGLQQQLADDKKELEGAAEKSLLLEPRLGAAESAGDETYNALRQAEDSWQNLQAEWDELNRSISGLDNRIEGNTTRKELLLSGLTDLEQRRNNLEEEAGALAPGSMEGEMAQLSAASSESEKLLGLQKNEFSETSVNLQRYRTSLAQINARIQELRTDYQKNESKIASLEALQQEQAHDYGESLEQWLTSLGLADAHHLIDRLNIEEGWETALEAAAGQRLQDLSVSDLHGPGGAAQALEIGKAGLLLDNADNINYTPRNWPRLIDRISSEVPVDAILNRIYLAENMEQAREICRELDETESVITRDGVWMNNYWVRIHRPAADDPGPLAREQELAALKDTRLKLENEISLQEDKAAENDRFIEEAERQSNLLLEQVNDRQESTAAARAQYTELKTRYEQARDRDRQIEQELRKLQQQAKEDQVEIIGLKTQLEQDNDSRRKLLAKRKRLETMRSEQDSLLSEARSRWQEANSESHSIALRLESTRAQKISMEQSIKRSETQLSATRERIRELETAEESQHKPLHELCETLDIKLADKVTFEAALTAARESVLQQEKLFRDKEQQRGECELELQELRTDLEQARIMHQEIIVRVQTLEERLEAAGQTPEALLNGLDEPAGKQMWQEKIDAVENRIQRLGAINLAAIDEFEQISERKTYLDSQYGDLSSALETLENAIHKIDKETRSRFKDTFDRLNANLKENFPLLFGGGHAYLEMTAQDLLETGVTVMARPPGKKNSNIHLLSGGEKALTAVALVFSIFKLNPAPFCILDEVDAPLDDNNVTRFSDMVKTMSKDVQFIIITHNKITMEITRQLLGVTMHEAGVSRLVSVDIDEAVEMAASA
ncbi:MAG: chromosome segregation protein SMC [Gammaproteobacteria bacterium]|nr:chromosome segregation protein SMC [Gammaproteobacteria bacterium]